MAMTKVNAAVSNWQSTANWDRLAVRKNNPNLVIGANLSASPRRRCEIGGRP
jgi:hypothetical protein